MNSRRFIRSSSQLEDDGAQSITSRWSPHSVRHMLRHAALWRRTAMGQKATFGAANLGLFNPQRRTSEDCRSSSKSANVRHQPSVGIPSDLSYNRI